jgi:hypothetical protein
MNKGWKQDGGLGWVREEWCKIDLFIDMFVPKIEIRFDVMEVLLSCVFVWICQRLVTSNGLIPKSEFVLVRLNEHTNCLCKRLTSH